MFKLSIFPNVKPLPANKEEKQREAKKTGVIRDKKTKEIIKEYPPEIVEIETDEDLIRVVQSYAWSPNIYNGCRLQENFKSTDFAVLDIDDGLTIEEAEKIVSEANFACLCLPSTSHTPELHKFRLIFPLSRTITNKEIYSATMSDLVSVFTSADPKCVHDYARFYFSGRDDDGFWIEGDLLEPVYPIQKPKNNPRTDFKHSTIKVSDDIKELVKELYGEDRENIPEVVSHFILNASTGLQGSWTMDLNNFAFTLSLQSVEEEVIVDLVEFLAPRGELTDRDRKTIKKAYEDGLELREVDND